MVLIWSRYTGLSNIVKSYAHTRFTEWKARLFAWGGLVLPIIATNMFPCASAS